MAEAETDGFIRVLTRRDGTIMGATIVAAPRAGEILTELVVAMENGLGLSDLASTVHAYPTWSTPVQRLAARASTDRFLGSWQGWLARKLAGL